MRHAELLGAKEPLMWRLVPVLTREMGQAFPELVRAEALIGETLKLEETRFRATLERGLAILDEKSAGLQKGAMFDGDTAFTLYDTYGFPLDLTQDALRARGISVDIASFSDAMERHRAQARAPWSGSGAAPPAGRGGRGPPRGWCVCPGGRKPAPPCPPAGSRRPPRAWCPRW